MVIVYFVVQLKILQGDICVEFYLEKVLKFVVNFFDYVKVGQYNGMIFYCVIKGFMIQGGGYKINFEEKLICVLILLESCNGLKNLMGMIVMVCMSDLNLVIVQFFINMVDNSGFDYLNLDGNGYVVFGKVVLGFDVVKKIEGVVMILCGLMQDVLV